MARTMDPGLTILNDMRKQQGNPLFIVKGKPACSVLGPGLIRHGELLFFFSGMSQQIKEQKPQIIISKKITCSRIC